MSSRIDSDTIGFLVADLSRSLRAEFDRLIGESGLSVTAGEARTLVHAARAGKVRQSALAERMAIEAMTLSDYLDRLEARRLVVRRPDPEDRRAKLVCLTARADGVLAEISAVIATLRAQASRGISAADWTRTIETLKQVRANLAATKPEADGREARVA